jgi:hypothetical protein
MDLTDRLPSLDYSLDLRRLLPARPGHCAVIGLDLGGTGDRHVWAVSGHVSDRRATSAVWSYLRHTLRMTPGEIAEQYVWADPVVVIRHRWVRVNGDGDAWLWADTEGPGTLPATLVELR